MSGTIEFNLLYKLAWSFHRTTGMEVDDLFQEAALAWCRAKKDPKYDPRISAINTYAYSATMSHLLTIVKYGKHPPTTELDENLAREAPAPDEIAEFHATLRGLTADAKLVVKLIFEAPHEFVGHEREVLHRISQILMHQYEYSKEQVEATFTIIRQGLRK